MFGNGAQIGILIRIIVSHRLRIHKGRKRVSIGYCAAARSTIFESLRGALSVAGTTLSSASALSVFGWLSRSPVVNSVFCLLGAVFCPVTK